MCQFSVRFSQQVEELYLDNVQSSQISGLSDEYTSLQKLSVVNCGLSSLEGLPKLPSLEKVLYLPTHSCYLAATQLSVPPPHTHSCYLAATQWSAPPHTPSHITHTHTHSCYSATTVSVVGWIISPDVMV